MTSSVTRLERPRVSACPQDREEALVAATPAKSGVGEPHEGAVTLKTVRPSCAGARARYPPGPLPRQHAELRPSRIHLPREPSMFTRSAPMASSISISSLSMGMSRTRLPSCRPNAMRKA